VCRALSIAHAAPPQDEARGRDEELRRVRAAADQLRMLVASGALTA